MGTSPSVLGRAIEQIKNVNKASIYITCGGITRRIPTNDILYLESENNKVKIALAKTEEKVSAYTKLDEFDEILLSNSFIRSHKSFLVNFLYIGKYENDRFELNDGTVIPISRKNRDKVKEAFYTLLHNQ